MIEGVGEGEEAGEGDKLVGMAGNWERETKVSFWKRLLFREFGGRRGESLGRRKSLSLREAFLEEIESGGNCNMA
jgi:hypothetical protein